MWNKIVNICDQICGEFYIKKQCKDVTASPCMDSDIFGNDEYVYGYPSVLGIKKIFQRLPSH